MQDLVVFKNNLTVLPKLKRTTKKKISHSSVSIFDMDEVGFMEEIGKSLSFLEVS